MSGVGAWSRTGYGFGTEAIGCQRTAVLGVLYNRPDSWVDNPARQVALCDPDGGTSIS